jgi:hypothetical protein
MQSFETCTMSSKISDKPWNEISDGGSNANLKRVLNLIEPYNDQITLSNVKVPKKCSH